MMSPRLPGFGGAAAHDFSRSDAGIWADLKQAPRGRIVYPRRSVDGSGSCATNTWRRAQQHGPPRSGASARVSSLLGGASPCLQRADSNRKIRVIALKGEGRAEYRSGVTLSIRWATTWSSQARRSRLVLPMPPRWVCTDGVTWPRRSAGAAVAPRSQIAALRPNEPSQRSRVRAATCALQACLLCAQ
jgi:hypothetical protein